MSSNDHIKFKTDATQKANTDTEIVSDAIILPPYSTDHVLTVTAPSSTSNLTGQVDVELEMSPDGENWCALQTEETITTEGGGTSTTGANAEDANLKAVSTVPDSNHNTGQYKNKFALGNLAYDDNGAETAVNQGSKDFMHQFMSKDKPFNYSLWYKTDTNAQAFGDDYTPVLFRHGGKDKFTNSNVVQLTDQGSSVGAQNNYYALRASTSNNSDIYVTKDPYLGCYGNQGTQNNITGGRDFTTTFWVYLDSTYTSQSSTSFGVVGQGTNAGVYFSVGIEVSAQYGFSAKVITNGGGAITGVPATTARSVMSNPNNISFANGWYLYSVSNDSGNNTLHYRIINQSGQLFREYYMAYTSFYDFDSAYSGGAGQSNQPEFSAVGQYTRVYGIAPNFIQDEFGTYDTYLSTSDLQKLTNGTTAVHPLNAGLSPTSYFRFGDVTGDTIANNTYIDTLVCDVGSTSRMKSYRSPPTSTSGMYTYQYDPVTYPHHAFMNYTPTGSKVTQNLCNADTSNSTYLQFNPMTTGNMTYSSFSSTSTSVISPFYNSSTNPTNAFPKAYTTETLRQDGDDDVSGGFSVGFWLKVDSPINTSNGYSSIINTFAGASNNILQLGICSYSGSFRFFWRMSSNTGTTLAYGILNGNNIASLPGSGWNYLVVKIDTTINNVNYAASISINGSAFSASAVTAANSSNGMAVLNGWGTNSDDVNVVKFNMNYNLNTQTVGANFAIDSLVFIDGLVGNSVVGSLYSNANNPYNAALDYTLQGLSSTGSGFTVNKYYTPSVRSFMKCGEGANDDISTAGAEVIEADNGLQMTAGNVTTKHTFANYVAGELPGAAVANSFPSVFNDTSSFSVSGWFKTVIGDTGTLFSNTGGTASTGLKVEVSGSGVTASYLGISNKVTSVSVNNLNDGNWHHIIMVMQPGSQLIVVDNFTAGTSSHTLATSELQGSNGFTLLSDGQNNIANTSPSSSDSSKLNASLSNWSIHSEDLDQYGIAQLYSNGHVRNIKNLPSVNPANIVSWWQLNDSANPEQDLSGNGYDLVLQDGSSLPLTNYVIGVTEGAPLIVEEDQYGSGITMSLTKRFDVVNNEWTNVHTHPTCICLSFNGFEDQAEYFAIYNPDTIDVANNAWHHTSLSFSGKEGSSTNNTVNFCFDSTTYNFVLSIDGNNYTTAHFVGGLGGPITNKCFPAEERHLKFVVNNQEDYMPHCQLNSNIFESINQTNQKYEPVVAKDYKTSFIGYADESSFHSESWFTDEVGTPTTSFNDQKTATLYGSTSTLSNRGVNSTIFTIGKPYPLRRPSIIGASTSTGNQYIDPNKYNASTNADGGLEAWWRWGDTVGDCSENINDAVGFESDPIDGHRSLKARNYISEEIDTDNDGVPDTPKDLIILTETDSIYVGEGSTSTGGGECTSVAYLPAIIENIQAGICNIKNLTLPVLQYIRIKFTNSGEAQLGKDKVEASIHYRKRR